jgi:hypothetical protein
VRLGPDLLPPSPLNLTTLAAAAAAARGVTASLEHLPPKTHENW